MIRLGFRDLQVARGYDTGIVGRRVLDEFYIPALENAVAYDRLAGFFESKSLAVAARGISGLTANGGRMRLIACPVLSPSDYAALSEYTDEDAVASLLAKRLLEGFDPAGLEDFLAADHVRAMCWMLAQGLLEIRIAIPRNPKDGGIYHQKVGILRDADGELLTFSGSINETAAGWLRNVEQFKVFRGWMPVEAEYVQTDITAFERYWGDSVPSVRTIDLPTAVYEKLLQSAPKSLSDLDLTIPASREPGATPAANKQLVLWPHQVDAVEAWVANGHMGILEMATGTGKTRAAFACLESLPMESSNRLVVIAVPKKHLATQWAEELVRAFPSASPVIAHSDSPGWQGRFLSLVSRLAVGGRSPGFVISTHETAASPDFLSLVRKAAVVAGGAVLVGDEMHALGATKTRDALDESYDMRLGLSATPARWFDEEGTKLLFDYFGGTVYSLPIDVALKTVIPATGLTLLTPYAYHPLFVSMAEDELERYQELTTRFARSMSASDTVSEEDSERYLFERAGVVKKAATKVGALEDVLGELGDKVSHCLIYCFDREQMADVEAVLATRPIVYAEFTGDESVRERQRLLRDFDSGDISVLVAMQCLDEGVDVPSARIGVMLASSTNPRESIQRRGRLLRRCPGKTRAVIYDVLVRPRPEAIGDVRFREIESRLFKKELERLEWFASCADNAAECWTLVIRELKDAS